MQTKKSKPCGLECALKKKLKKTYMQRTLCQVFPAEGKLPVGGFAARKILPCKLGDNCGNSVCINLILSGCTIFAVCCLQRLPELLPRDENATPPIPENRAHGLVGYMVKGWIGTYLFSDHLVKYIKRKTET